ncbi:hypothetical protein [Emergencia sp. 1XD21-10]|uniref:hypothetical protein n=1 Tax=Emergencia sp. 1XD21-10 TaxID=2304569 RepID=UPI00137A859A|nr:hypothetical protein [Emergencia sp. 1XD21-10]
MSEELKKGIPKAVQIGKGEPLTKEEVEYYDVEFEKILKEAGVLKECESINDMENLE